jgi:lipopolysaccharide biosynthesis protein
VFHHSSPQLFARWLTNAFADTLLRFDQEDERLVFINAWNEWAEGAHLEPDRRYGYAWLQAVCDAHENIAIAKCAKTAVVIHAYYLDIFQEICESAKWFSQAPGVRVYVTTTHEKKRQVERIVSKYFWHASIFSFENRGRDVLPFLKIIDKLVADGNNIVIKIHTKRSPHRNDGDRWRQELFSQLLSFPGYIQAVNRFKRNDKLGILSPDGNLVPISYYWGSNQYHVNKLCERYRIAFSPDDQFVAGTMFICRIEVIKKLSDHGPVLDSDFEPESGQLDGTMAHAYERFCGIFSRAHGFVMETFTCRRKDFVYADKIM